MKTLYSCQSVFFKQFFCILFFAIIAIATQAQNWPEPGASWEYCLNPPTVWDEEGVKTFAYTTDTTINGKSYAVIRHISTNDQVFEVGTEYDYDHRVYVRTSNDTIYRNVNGTDHIFYIYGLEIGEGFSTFRTSFYEYSSYSCDPEIHLEVIEVSTIEIGEETYTVVLLEDTNFTYVYDNTFDPNPHYAFVEGVGLRNDFPFLYHLALADEGEPCYLSTDGIGYISLNKYTSNEQFIDFNECFSVSVEEQKTNGFSIFPNPVSEGFRLENPEAGRYTLQSLIIYNQQGQMIKSLNPQNRFHSLSGLPAGLYILQIELENGFTWEKLVKE